MVIEAKNPSSLRLKLDCGLNELTGKTVVKSKTFSNVRPNSSVDDVYEVAVALGSLQKYDVIEIAKIDSSTLA